MISNVVIYSPKGARRSHIIGFVTTRIRLGRFAVGNNCLASDATSALE
ncbi:hypothetical protein ACFLRW_02110 [Acidobacteriota bacterium]